ncbi:MAG TPA: hypothetical protein VFX48_04640 [Saprospiraceae bacterium]|nr:hypothetical protein [Saprospiraceae bacterium]
MNSYPWILLLFAALLTSCNTKPAGPMESNATQTERSTDSLAITETISGFLGWYKTNYDSAISFRWVTSDAKGYYLVNTENCEAWLKFLAGSGFLSEKYLNDGRRYFEKESANLREHPQNEGPPEGFNMDLVLWTQEPELTLDSIAHLRYHISGPITDSAWVLVENYNPLDFQLKKYPEGWRIEKISVPAPE